MRQNNQRLLAETIDLHKAKDANGASSETLQSRSVGSGKTEANVFKNGPESPWDATLNEPAQFHDIFECLRSVIEHKKIVPNERPASIVLLSWSSYTKTFTRKLRCSP